MKIFKDLIQIIKELCTNNPPVDLIETKIFNSEDNTRGLPIKDINFDLATNNSSFETKIFGGN